MYIPIWKIHIWLHRLFDILTQSTCVCCVLLKTLTKSNAFDFVITLIFLYNQCVCCVFLKTLTKSNTFDFVSHLKFLYSQCGCCVLLKTLTKSNTFDFVSHLEFLYSQCGCCLFWKPLIVGVCLLGLSKPWQSQMQPFLKPLHNQCIWITLIAILMW